MDPPPRPPPNRFRIRVAVFEPEQALDLDAPPKHSMLIARSDAFPLQDLPLRALCDEAVRRYKLIYPTESLFEIKKSQDSYGCDLLLDDRVGDIFADNEVFRIVKGASVRSSLAPEYVRGRSESAQPEYSSYAKRSHTALNNGNIERATKRQRVNERDPDEPVRSVERDSLDLDETALQGPISSATVIPDSQEGIKSNGIAPKANGVSQHHTGKPQTSPDLDAPYVTPKSKSIIPPPRQIFAAFPKTPTYHIERTTQNGRSISTGITTPASPEKDEVAAAVSIRSEQSTVNGKEINGRKRALSRSHDIYDDIETDLESPKRKTPKRPVTALNSALKSNSEKSVLKANARHAMASSFKLRTPINRSRSPAGSAAHSGSPDMSKEVESTAHTVIHGASAPKLLDSQMPDRDSNAEKAQLRRAAAEAAENRRQAEEAVRKTKLEAESAKSKEEVMQKESDAHAAEKARIDPENKLQEARVRMEAEEARKRAEQELKTKRAAEAQAKREAAAEARKEADANAKRKLEETRTALEEAKSELEGDSKRKEAADLKAKKAAEKLGKKDAATSGKVEKLKLTDQISQLKETAEPAEADMTLSSGQKPTSSSGGTILPGAKPRGDRGATPSATQSHSTIAVPSRLSVESKSLPDGSHPSSNNVLESNIQPPLKVRRSVSFGEPVASVGPREETPKSSSPKQTSPRRAIGNGILKQTRIVPPPPRLSKASSASLLNDTPSRTGNSSLVKPPTSSLKVQTTLVPIPKAQEPHAAKSKSDMVTLSEEEVSASEEESGSEEESASGSEEESGSEEGSGSEKDDDRESKTVSKPEMHSAELQLPPKPKPARSATRDEVTNPKVLLSKSSRSTSIESYQSDARESHSPIRYSQVRPLHIPQPSAILVDKFESRSTSPSNSSASESSSDNDQNTHIPQFAASPIRRRQTSSISSSTSLASSQDASQSQIDAQLIQPSPPSNLNLLRTSQPSLRRMTQNLQASKEASLRTATAKTIAKQQALADLAARRVAGNDEEEEEEEEEEESSSSDDDDDVEDDARRTAKAPDENRSTAAMKSPVSSSDPGSAKKAHKKPNWGKLGMMFSLKKQ